MGAIRAAICDGVLTFMWVFCVSTVGPVTYVIAAALGIKGFLSLVITTVLVFLLLFIFGFIAEILGGATFNPTATAAFYAAGVRGVSLFSAALRFPAQVPTSNFSFIEFIILYVFIHVSCGLP